MADKTNVIIGELGLDGTIRPVHGIIGKLMSGPACGATTFFVPVGNTSQAQMVLGIRIIAIRNLRDLFLHLNEVVAAKTIETKDGIYKALFGDSKHGIMLSDLVGPAQAKRALEIAAVGAHILLNDPPGACWLGRCHQFCLPKVRGDARGYTFTQFDKQRLRTKRHRPALAQPTP